MPVSNNILVLNCMIGNIRILQIRNNATTLFHYSAIRGGRNKYLVKQLISAKGMSLLFHYGSNLTSCFPVPPLKQQKTAAVASLRCRMKVYLSGRGLHFLLFCSILLLLAFYR